MIPRSSVIPPQPDKPCTVLTVNLHHEDAAALGCILNGSNWILTGVSNCREALAYERFKAVSVVVCGPLMPDGSWNTLLHALGDIPDAPALIVVSRFADEHLWAEVLNLGGYDVLATPFDKNEVLRMLYLTSTTRKRKLKRKPSTAATSVSVEGLNKPVLKRMSASGGD